MSTILAGVVKIFPRATIYSILLKLAEYAVAQTDNTLDDELIAIIKKNIEQ